MIAEEAWCCHRGWVSWDLEGGWETRSPPEESGVEKLWDARGAVSGRWETSVPAFKLANDGLSTGSKSNWIVQQSPETGAANRFVLFLTSLNIIWINPLTHTYCIYMLCSKSFWAPIKVRIWRWPGYWWREAGMRGISSWIDGIPSNFPVWLRAGLHQIQLTRSIITFVHNSQGSSLSARFGDIVVPKLVLGKTLKGFVSLPGGMLRLSCFLSFL